MARQQISGRRLELGLAPEVEAEALDEHRDHKAAHELADEELPDGHAEVAIEGLVLEARHLAPDANLEALKPAHQGPRPNKNKKHPCAPLKFRVQRKNEVASQYLLYSLPSAQAQQSPYLHEELDEAEELTPVLHSSWAAFLHTGAGHRLERGPHMRVVNM